VPGIEPIPVAVAAGQGNGWAGLVTGVSGTLPSLVFIAVTDQPRVAGFVPARSTDQPVSSMNGTEFAAAPARQQRRVAALCDPARAFGCPA
jgi:hypothetical protein